MFDGGWFLDERLRDIILATLCVLLNSAIKTIYLPFPVRDPSCQRRHSITLATNLLLKHIKMGFGDVSTAAGVKALNDFLAERAYVEGFVPSQVDVAVFEAMGGKAPGADMAHALRYVKLLSVMLYQRTFWKLEVVT